MSARRAAAWLALSTGVSACFDGVFGSYDLAGGGASAAGGGGAGGVARGHDAGSSGAPGGESGLGGAGATAGDGGAGGAGGPSGSSGQGGSVSGSSGQGGAGGAAGGGEGGAAGDGGSGGLSGGGMSGTSGQGGGAGSSSVCAGKSGWACDPTSTTSCGTTPGSACDIDVNMAKFVCFGPPNALALGAPCKLSGPEFCEQGLTCLNGACARFCCDDGPCVGETRCLPGNLPGVTVGLCSCDPAVTAALGPTLDNLLQQYAPGDAREGTPLCGLLAEGASLEKQVVLMPGRCYTAAAVADSSAVQIVLRLDTDGSPPMLLTSSGAPTAAPVLGPQPGCYKPIGTSPVSAVFQIVSKKGSAHVLAQLTSK